MDQPASLGRRPPALPQTPILPSHPLRWRRRGVGQEGPKCVRCDLADQPDRCGWSAWTAAFADPLARDTRTVVLWLFMYPKSPDLAASLPNSELLGSLRFPTSHLVGAGGCPLFGSHARGFASSGNPSQGTRHASADGAQPFSDAASCSTAGDCSLHSHQLPRCASSSIGLLYGQKVRGRESCGLSRSTLDVARLLPAGILLRRFMATVALQQHHQLHPDRGEAAGSLRHHHRRLMPRRSAKMDLWNPHSDRSPALPPLHTNKR